MCRRRASPPSACHILILILNREIINRRARGGQHEVTGLTEARPGTVRAEQSAPEAVSEFPLGTAPGALG